MTDDRERGAALVEFALILTFLLMLSLGAFEYGMAFRDWLSVSAATREGVRVASAAGDTPGADCVILEATAGALRAISNGEIAEVWIYKSDTTGAVTARQQRYRPALPSDDPATLQCNTWYPIMLAWPESSRDNDGGTRDWVGVRVRFDHEWITNFLWWNGSVRWTDDAVMHLEPAMPS
ncbi:MAG TPA: pilus assembly protein [Acidimicrobiia bacterium]|nr:pilus assembly protein [Acidimicrobiia bacterium]